MINMSMLEDYKGNHDEHRLPREGKAKNHACKSILGDGFCGKPAKYLVTKFLSGRSLHYCERCGDPYAKYPKDFRVKCISNKREVQDEDG